MKKILLATGNQGKVLEFGKLFENFNNVELLSLKDFEKIEEPEETGKTFEENSLQKSTYYGEKLKISTIADDSGLWVNALGGFPGIYSGRFNNGEKKDFSFSFNALKLLLDYNDIKDFSAKFCCSITFYNFETKEHNSFLGEIEGKLIFPPRGNGGFGYDPIFMPNGYNKTFGEFTMEEKNSMSHRGIALKKFEDWLKNKFFC